MLMASPIFQSVFCCANLGGLCVCRTRVLLGSCIFKPIWATALQACDGDQELAEGAGIWLASRDLAALQKEVQSDGGFVAVRLNGKLLRLKEGGHFRLPARRTAPSS